MKVVCAWCKKVLSDDGKPGVSHGICDSCSKKEKEEYKKRKR